MVQRCRKRKDAENTSFFHESGPVLSGLLSKTLGFIAGNSLFLSYLFSSPVSTPETPDSVLPLLSPCLSHPPRGLPCPWLLF